MTRALYTPHKDRATPSGRAVVNGASFAVSALRASVPVAAAALWLFALATWWIV